MTERPKVDLHARIAERPAAVPTEGPFSWTVRLTNSGSATIHLATGIQQVRPSLDGRTLTVSTERPIFDSSVNFALFRLETRAIQPGETVDHQFSLEFPLRLVTMAGFPPRAQTELWTPAAQFSLVTQLAYGDRPFQLPASPRRLGASLRAWTNVLEAPAMRLRPTRKQEE